MELHAIYGCFLHKLILTDKEQHIYLQIKNEERESTQIFSMHDDHLFMFSGRVLWRIKLW
jgi:hypothetical protein